MAKKKGKATAKKTMTAPNLKAIQPTNKARSKSQVIGVIAECTGLNRKDVSNIFSTMSSMIEKDLGKKGPGIFTVPGLMKIKVIHKPATKARKGVNPFTGQEMMFKARPARNMVRVRPLKALKDMVN